MKETYSINFQDFKQFSEAHNLLKANGLLDEPVTNLQRMQQQYGGSEQCYAQQTRKKTSKNNNSNEEDPRKITMKQLDLLKSLLESKGINESNFCAENCVAKLTDLCLSKSRNLIKDLLKASEASEPTEE